MNFPCKIVHLRYFRLIWSSLSNSFTKRKKTVWNKSHWIVFYYFFCLCSFFLIYHPLPPRHLQLPSSNLACAMPYKSFVATWKKNNGQKHLIDPIGRIWTRWERNKRNVNFQLEEQHNIVYNPKPQKLPLSFSRLFLPSYTYNTHLLVTKPTHSFSL